MPAATRRSSTGSTGSRSKLEPGDIAAAWMESSLVHGEGDLFGEPFALTDDERRFLVALYRQDRAGRRVVQRALLGRAKAAPAPRAHARLRTRYAWSGRYCNDTGH